LSRPTSDCRSDELYETGLTRPVDVPAKNLTAFGPASRTDPLRVATYLQKERAEFVDVVFILNPLKRSFAHSSMLPGETSQRFRFAIGTFSFPLCSALGI
jgi:hypothetical protein